VPSKGSGSGKFALVVAHDEQLGIGKNGALPWKIKGDMQFFRTLTTTVADNNLKNAVIMGRKTWESLPERFRPLPNRYNFVLTKSTSQNQPKSVYFCHDFKQVFSTLNQLEFESCFVIGGAQIYKSALEIKKFNLIYVTEIIGNFNCDVFFPEYRQAFTLQEQSDIDHADGYTYRFSIYSRK